MFSRTAISRRNEGSSKKNCNFTYAEDAVSKYEFVNGKRKYAILLALQYSNQQLLCTLIAFTIRIAFKCYDVVKSST